MAEWPCWERFEEIVAEGTAMSANTDFNDFKKTVLKASISEIEQQAEHAPATWSFLLAFAAVKKIYRRLIIQVFNKLMQAPGWAAAWEAQPKLKDQIRGLHVDLQVALGLQHELLMKSIAPGAMQQAAHASADEKPETVQVEMQREKILDEIRDETAETRPDAFGGMDPAEDDGAAADPLQSDLAVLQEGIDAVLEINSTSRMMRRGLGALHLLRIGCVQCAGKEQIFQQEVGYSHQVFSFLLNLSKCMPDGGTTKKVAEVMNQLMASPSWSRSLESSTLLQETLQELPQQVQAALGLQHEKIMELISEGARRHATGDEASELNDFHKVAAKMQSVRFALPPDTTSAPGPHQPRAKAAAAAAARGAQAAPAAAAAAGRATAATAAAPAQAGAGGAAEAARAAVAVAAPAQAQARAAAAATPAVRAGYPAEAARPAAPAQAAAEPPRQREWQEAKTPEGHCYYFNLRTRASQWERPEELGGPYQYTPGEEVDVWSNSQKKWGRGRVEKVENGRVTAEFNLPGGGTAKKELPANHKDLRPVAAAPEAAEETWSAEEKAAYKGWFARLEGPKDAKPTAAVATFLLSSGLPKRALKQVWAVANPENTPDLDLDTFSRCCRCVGHCQAFGLDSELVTTADRPLRVRLREQCLQTKPPQLPSFS